MGEIYESRYSDTNWELSDPDVSDFNNALAELNSAFNSTIEFGQPCTTTAGPFGGIFNPVLNQKSKEILDAAELGDVAALRSAIQTAGEGDLDATIGIGETPLMRAVCNGHTECARMLIEAGCDPDLADDCDETALLTAVKRNNVEVVRLLAEHNANMDIEDEEENTPLLEAISCGKLEIVKILIENGCNLQYVRGFQFPLMEACERGSEECVQLLIDAGCDIDAEDSSGATALNSAAGYGRPECIRLLLDAGCSKLNGTEKGLSALFSAASKGRAECIRVLIEAGCNVDVANKHGETPLFNAATATRDSSECVEQLIEAGCDVDVENRRGKTALELVADSVCGLHLRYREISLALADRISVIRLLLGTGVRRLTQAYVQVGERIEGPDYVQTVLQELAEAREATREALLQHPLGFSEMTIEDICNFALPQYTY